MSKENCRKIIIASFLFIAALIAFTVFLFPYTDRLSEPQYQAEIKCWVSSMGVSGFLLLLGIQVLQVIIAFIPGEPVEILAGALYGTWGGLFICLWGCVIASSVIFTLSKRFGKKLLYMMFGEDKVQHWKWLQNSTKTEIITFVLFFIPGTPKDMLTYIVGITKMSALRFISITTLARIPSVLSSAMIGSAVCRGEWELSVCVFIITGIIGIIGIGTRDKIITACRKKGNFRHDTGSSCECMDLIEIAHKDRIYPLIFCKMKISGQLDIQRLKTAIQQSARYVPEIMQSFDFDKKRFVDRHLSVDQILSVDGCDFDGCNGWNLSRDVQLKVAVFRNPAKENVIIGMSHILTDGNGFLQYLYLLSALYNKGISRESIINCRRMKSVFGHIPFGASGIRRTKDIEMQPLCGTNQGNKSYCICSSLCNTDFLAVRMKARKCKATLNDVFMTAYARVIARQQNKEFITIPCPADLRRFFSTGETLTVANMTGLFRTVSVRVKSNASFDAILLQIHTEMQKQKEKLKCFKGIGLLNFAFHKIPSGLLTDIIRSRYRVNPVSYSNMGRIDAEKLAFENCFIENCYLAGTYRKAPDFQLSVTTFRDCCTLNCMLIGNEQRRKEGQYILSEVKRELLQWIQVV